MPLLIRPYLIIFFSHEVVNQAKIVFQEFLDFYITLYVLTFLFYAWIHFRLVSGLFFRAHVHTLPWDFLWQLKKYLLYLAESNQVQFSKEQVLFLHEYLAPPKLWQSNFPADFCLAMTSNQVYLDCIKNRYSGGQLTSYGRLFMKWNGRI